MKQWISLGERIAGPEGFRNRIVLLWLVILVVAGGAPAAMAAPPENDDFAQALLLAGASGTTSSLISDEATLESTEPSHGGVAGLTGSVWWTWTPTTTATATFDTIGSDFDTVLAVYTGADYGTLVEVASSDDANGTSQSAVTFSALPSEIYRVAVAGASGTTGSLTLNWVSCADPLTTAGEHAPFDGETTSVLVTELDWEDVPGATVYEVYLDGSLLGRTDESTISLGGAAVAGAHQWRVVVYDDCTSVTGDLWSYDDSCSAPGPEPERPSPANGETTLTTISRLDWADVPGAVSYDVEIDGSFYGTTTSSEIELPPGGLLAGPHTWRVSVQTTCPLTVGPLWRFLACEPQAGATSPSPADGETTACGLSVFDWEDAAGAVSYDVYLNSVLLGNTASSDFSPAMMLPPGQHVWQVVTNGDCFSTTGSEWTFELFDTPSLPVPADGETTGCDLAALDWEDVCGARSYDLYIDSILTTSGLGTSDFVLTAPLGSGLHTWQVVARSVDSFSTGPVWSLCLMDAPASALLPAEGAVLFTSPDTFDWDDVCGATTYTFHLDGAPVAVTSDSQAVLTSGLPGLGDHVWQVEAEGECSTTSGPIWRFSLQCPVPSAPTGPSPASGETTGCDLALLDWEDVTDVSGYRVLLDGTEIGQTSESQFALTPLTGGSHVWRIVAMSDCGEETTSSRWNFCLIDTPSIPLPLDGEALSTSPTILDWEDACGATTYVVTLDSVVVAVTTESSATIGAELAGAGSHSWQVRAENECGGVDGPVWTFSVACPSPGRPVGPMPSDGLTTGCTLAVLDWADSTDATGYRVYLNGSEVAETSDSVYVLDAPLPSGENRWQIVALNDCGSVTTGSEWNVCLLDAPALIAPADSGTTDCAAVHFDWSDTCGASMYDLYIDGSLVGSTSASDLLVTAPLEPGLHTWQVHAIGETCGEVASEEGTFCLQGAPSLPVPADGQTTACGLARLEWQAACGADSYDVYIDSGFVGSVTTTSITLGSTLTPGAHTWYVLAQGCGVTSSPVWNLCVLDAPSIPVPSDNSVTAGPLDTFDWANTCGATTYTLVVDGVVTGTTTVSQFTLPSGPLANGVHTWQVIAENECSMVAGPEWTVYVGCSTIPEPSGPDPADGSTTHSGISRLSWDEIPAATSYKVYLNGIFRGTTSVPYATVTLPIGTYTWQIGVNSTCGELLGPVWTFQVCDVPEAPILLSPVDGVTTNPEAIFFDWTDAASATSYLLIIDNTSFGPLLQSEYQMPYSLTSGPHEWRVVARNGCAETTSTDFTFCGLAPPIAVEPVPDTIDCMSPSKYDWIDVSTATGYDVYIDEVLVSSNQQESEYFPTVSLSEGAHTWRVVARSDCGEMSGPLWNFTLSTSQAGPRQNMWVTNGAVYAMAVSGNVVYIGGSFTVVGSANGSAWVPRANLAAIDMSTGQATSWVANTDAPVRALTCDSGILFVGGEFDFINGTLRNYVGAVSEATGAVLPWNPECNNRVEALAVAGSTVYAGGRFTSFGGQLRRHAAAADKSNGAVTAWNPDANSQVRAVCPMGSSVLVGGNFSFIGGQTRSGFAAVDPATGALQSWGSGVDFYVNTIAYDGTKVYIGGLFNSAGNQARRNLAAFDAATGALLSWAPETNGAVNALAVAGNTIYAGGLFSTVGGQSRPYMSALSGSTGEAPNCGYDPDYPVWALAVAGETVCVGGDFTYIGTSSMRGFAAFGGTSDPGSGVGDWKQY